MTDRTENRYWDPELETQSRQDWEALKLDLLKKHLAHAYKNSPYYRQSFDAAGVHPSDLKCLKDLTRFPTINKKILRERQETKPLLGDIASVPESEVVYVSASSGSTGALASGRPSQPQ